MTKMGALLNTFMKLLNITNYISADSWWCLLNSQKAADDTGYGTTRYSEAGNGPQKCAPKIWRPQSALDKRAALG